MPVPRPEVDVSLEVCPTSQNKAIPYFAQTWKERQAALLCPTSIPPTIGEFPIQMV